MSRDLRVNQMIRIPNVRVVDENGSQLGVMPTAQALAMAQDRGFDLVEVAPMASPPVTRFLDYGQYKYELAKRDKEAKRRSRAVEFKEVRLRPKIGVGDFDTKVHRAIEFLEDGDRLKVTVQFRGREMTHPEIGRNLLERFVKRIEEHGVVERAPLMEGRSMHLTVASVHKPRSGDAKPDQRADTKTGPKTDEEPRPKSEQKTEQKTERKTEPPPAGGVAETENGEATTAEPPAPEAVTAVAVEPVAGAQDAAATGE